MTQNLMFLSDHVNNAIMRANLDGTGLTASLIPGRETPRGLTVDPHHGRLYWLEGADGRLYSAALDGTGVTTVLAATFAGARDLSSFESTDTDGDFLDDEWENAYFGNLDGDDPSADSDDDGLSDGGELLFGSSPVDPTDTGRVLIDYAPGVGGGILRFSYREREEPWLHYGLMHSPNWSGWSGAPAVVGSTVEYPDGHRTRMLDVDASVYDPTISHFFRVDVSR